MSTTYGRSARALATALLLGTAPAALFAQTAATTPPAPDQNDTPAPGGSIEGDGEEIVVTGTRMRGSAIGDIPAEITLSPGDVRSYGVSNVTELLSELAPQTGSAQGSGQPVVLLNGKRISGMQEIRDIPTEAIQRVEVLPEEVALKYGYRPTQKVVNFVLRERFRAVTGEVGGGIATDGGAESGRAEADLLRIRDGGRLNLSLDYRRSAGLKESDRDIISTSAGRPFDFVGNVGTAGGASQIDPALSAAAGQVVTIAGVSATAAAGRPVLSSFVPTANVANVSDIAPFRSLRPSTDQFDANAVLARSFGDVSATFNASFGATGSDRLSGLPGASLILPAGNPFSPFGQAVTVDRYFDGSEPLRQATSGETYHAGFTFAGDNAGWNWSVLGNYDRSDSRTDTETGYDLTQVQAQLNAGSATLNPFGTIPASLIAFRANDRANSTQNTGNIQLVANRGLFALPAGEVQTTLKVGGEILGFDSASFRSGVANSTDLSRRDGNAQVNLDVPLTSTREGFLAAIGTLSANVNYAVNELSDFGTLQTIGAGLTWRPFTGMTVLYSYNDQESAPSVQQLGNPQVLTPAVRTFDYLRGTTVDIAQITGGNPNLDAESRRVHKFGLTYKPFEKTDLTLTANYVDTRIDNLIASLPAPTAVIEAAFPDRFIRDADGDLVSIDSRPVNYAREDRKQLRWGFNFSKPLKSTNNERLRAAFQALRNRDGTQMRMPGAPPPGADAARAAQGQGRQGQQGQPQPGGPPPEAQAQGQQGPGQGGGQGGFRGPGGGPGGPGGFRGPGGPFGGGPGGGGGRLQFAVYHTWLFKDDILIRPGVPVLDLLDGATNGQGGGQSRHQIEVQSGYFNNGIGARLTLNWQSATEVRGGTGTSTGDLFFNDLATANFRLFANLAQFPDLVKYSWARGTRVSLAVNNIFNQRQKVRDAAGLTPLGYQPDYLDPVGREVRFTIRKLFF